MKLSHLIGAASVAVNAVWILLPQSGSHCSSSASKPDVPQWQTQIFLDPDHDSTHDCSLCFVAHLITNSDVIEGSRKACGEVIGLSSEEKHQAGGIIPEEFIQAAHKECAANVSCCEKMKRFGFFICKGWEDKKCERTLPQTLHTDIFTDGD